jgi:hypothetical protein
VTQLFLLCWGHSRLTGGGTVVGDVTFDTITMVSYSKEEDSMILCMHTDTSFQVNRGLAVHAWPTGHATDMEETIKFTQLQDVDCMIQKFPLEKANEAFGEHLVSVVLLCWIALMQSLCRRDGQR